MLKKIISPILLTIIILIFSILIEENIIVLPVSTLWVGMILGIGLVFFIRLTIILMKGDKDETEK